MCPAYSFVCLLFLQSFAVGLASKDTVIIAVHRENMDWVSRVQEARPNITIKMYQSRNSSLSYFVENFGAESCKYLSAIVAHYNEMPDKMLFLHGHWTAPHNKHRTALEIIDDWLLWPTDHRFIAVPTRRINHNKIHTSRFVILKRIAARSPATFGRIPEYSEAACCAQFAINREAVTQHPYAVWTYALKLCLGTRARKGDPGDPGLAFERFWKNLFAPDCPALQPYRCS